MRERDGSLKASLERIGQAFRWPWRATLRVNQSSLHPHGWFGVFHFGCHREDLVATANRLGNLERLIVDRRGIGGLENEPGLVGSVK